MDERKMSKPAKSEVCTHCKSYAGRKVPEPEQTLPELGEETLCGNCVLISPKRRLAERNLQTRIAEGRKKADEAAKRAHQDELRKLNEEAVVEVVGEGDKKTRQVGAE